MMPISQIDMVILKEDGKSLQVCGGLKRETGNLPGRPAYLYIVVRQEDVIATGNETSPDDGTDRWKVREVKVQGGPTTQLRAGRAIACGVAIVEKDDPAGLGLEAFSWAQQVNLRTGVDPEWIENPPPIDFGEAELAVKAGGKLGATQAIASSLAILPLDGGGYGWAHEVEMRAVKEALIISLPS
jgi:hypothetical protein